MQETLKLQSVREEYLLSCQIDGKAEGTLKIYSLVTRLLAEFLGGEEITPHSIRRFLLWLSEDRTLNTTTVNIYARALRTYVRWMTREGYLWEDTMKDIKTPKVPRKFPNVLPDDDLKRLLAVAKSEPRDNAILLFLLDTGVRAGELCGLSLEDISLGTSTARVLGKGGKERTVFYSKITAKALAKWLSFRPPVLHDDPVFTSQKRKERLTPHGLIQVVQRLARKASIERRVTPHTLRHTFATLYIRNGGDSHTLQHLLGHSTLAMAQRYVDLVGRDLSEAHSRYSPVARITNRKGASW
jgi:integrase/recombinase XerD